MHRLPRALHARRGVRDIRREADRLARLVQPLLGVRHRAALVVLLEVLPGVVHALHGVGDVRDVVDQAGRLRELAARDVLVHLWLLVLGGVVSVGVLGGGMLGDGMLSDGMLSGGVLNGGVLDGGMLNGEVLSSGVLSDRVLAVVGEVLALVRGVLALVGGVLAAVGSVLSVVYIMLALVGVHALAGVGVYALAVGVPAVAVLALLTVPPAALAMRVLAGVHAVLLGVLALAVTLGAVAEEGVRSVVLAVAMVWVSGMFAIVVRMHSVVFGGLVVDLIVFLPVLVIGFMRMSTSMRRLFVGFVLECTRVRSGILTDVRLSDGRTCDETTELDRICTFGRVRWRRGGGRLDETYDTRDGAAAEAAIARIA